MTRGEVVSVEVASLGARGQRFWICSVRLVSPWRVCVYTWSTSGSSGGGSRKPSCRLKVAQRRFLVVTSGAQDGSWSRTGGCWDSFSSCTKQADLDPECGTERAAFVDSPPPNPPPVDFTVNRASPLVTVGQCGFLPLFQPRRVRAARRLL